MSALEKLIAENGLVRGDAHTEARLSANRLAKVCKVLVEALQSAITHLEFDDPRHNPIGPRTIAQRALAKAESLAKGDAS